MPHRLPRAVFVLAALMLLATAYLEAATTAPVGEGREGPRELAGPPVLRLEVTGVDANGTRPPDDATMAGVSAALDRWVADAVVAPLFSGRPSGDLAPVFTAPALERLADPAVRATLVDEGMPPATWEITAAPATAALSSVAGPDEVVGLVAARVDLKVHAVGPSLDVDVVHYGDFVLAPDGDVWKIESFSMHTTRDSREAA